VQKQPSKPFPLAKLRLTLRLRRLPLNFAWKTQVASFWLHSWFRETLSSTEEEETLRLWRAALVTLSSSKEVAGRAELPHHLTLYQQ
jgi:hypothetical protein